MINLRYHIVSLTAVFLALGIGVLLGGTYLDKYTVDQLDQSISNAEERIRETSAENDRLRGEIGDAEARDRALLDVGTSELFGAKLVDVPVVVVAAEGTDETVRRNLIRAVTNSGADFRGTLTVTGALDDIDDARAESVAEALDLTASTPSAVRGELIDQFGEALAAAGAAPDEPEPGAGTDTTQPGADGSTTSLVPTTTVDPNATTTVPPGAVDPSVTLPTEPPQQEAPQQPEVLTVLLAEGLLSFEAPTRPSASGPLLSEQGYRFLFVSGDEPAVPDATFLVPVLRRMADAGPVPVVVAAQTPADGDVETVVSTSRGDAELSRLVSTVDNLESFNGVASSILALDEIGRGARGHYGEGRGASAPLPSGA
jgi:hypothetical protein